VQLLVGHHRAHSPILAKAREIIQSGRLRGTAGPMAAVKAKERNPSLRVLLLEKANVKRSGAISMGMDNA
jgi:hypothetical protein